MLHRSPAATASSTSKILLKLTGGQFENAKIKD